ncbi:hypothetical protein Syun_001486 [Stephania yunnanensis]|uniref:Uncharacterized protein n=1 Tax=Stephania yunnanensis TaxID=152371 RepID=A0AAP0QAY4_9MAGN
MGRHNRRSRLEVEGGARKKGEGWLSATSLHSSLPPPPRSSARWRGPQSRYVLGEHLRTMDRGYASPTLGRDDKWAITCPCSPTYSPGTSSSALARDEGKA